MRQSPKRSFTLFVAGLLLSTAGVAAAGERDAAKRDPAKRGEMMEKRVVEKLGPSLGLDEAKSKELAVILKESAQARMAAMKDVKAERDALKQLVENKAPADVVAAQRAQVEAAMAKVPSKLDVLASTSRILDAEQQAKLTLKLSGHEGGKRGMRHGKKGEGRRAPKAE